MACETKFGWLSGYSLVFAAFQPCGEGRGIEQQPLTERRPTGYYYGTPLTDLVAGDYVLVYVLEPVLYEGEPVSILTEDSVYYEGERVSYEGEWVINTDSTIGDPLTWVGDPVGEGEYSSAIDIWDILNQLIIGQNTVINVYPQPETGGTGGLSGAQLLAHLHKLEDENIGYFKRKRLEKYG